MNNELKVGLTVLAAVVGLFFGIRFLQGSPLLSGRYEVVAVFDNARGLAPGSAVRVNGVEVGSVSEIALSDDARQVYVLLRLNNDTVIPRGSHVATGGLAALGDVRVDITPPAGASAGRPFAAGDTLWATPVRDLFAMLSDESGPIARTDSLLASATSVMRGMDDLIGASGDNVAASAAQLRFITTATGRLIRAESERLDAMLASLQRAALSAERAAVHAERLAADVSGRGPGVADSLEMAVYRLNTTMAQVESSLLGFDRVSGQLEQTLAQINSNDGTLGLLLNDPSLYRNADATMLSFQELLTDFKNDPARYLSEMRLVDIF